VVEGGAFTIEVTTTGVAQGSVAGRIETYTITGAGIDHIPAAERTGQITLDANGKASVTVHTLADLGSLGFKPINIQVGTSAPVTVDILDQAFQTISLNPPSADINQGQSVTFTINTAGVAPGVLAGTVQSWTLTGSGTNQVTGGVLSGTVTLDANNSAVVTIGTDFSIINMNGQFGAPGTQNLVFRLDSGGFPTLSPSVTIHESTLSVTAPVAPIVEGNQVTFTLTGVNIPSGSTYTYTLSGSAIGNVVPTSQIHGTVTINNGTATVVVNTLSNDASGATKGLTLTIDQVSTATGTAQIAETAPISFILTTGTDNFVGNPDGKNTFFAVANSNPLVTSSTLGQNDNLDGGGTKDDPNTLFLQTAGLLPQTINAFTTHNIQIFNINAGQAGAGTTIDMSSVFGMTKVQNVNSSGKLTLLNVTQATDVELINPSDIFGTTVDMAVQYQNNPQKPSTQKVLLDPTVSPITGLANSRFWVNVDRVTITSTGPGTNGLLTVNGATNGFGPTALTTLTLLGAANFLSGSAGSGQVATTFTNAGFAAGSNLLDLSNFGGVYFNIGDAGAIEAITSVGGLTIEAGAGGIQGVYVPGPGFTGATQVGGQTTVIGGDFALNLRGGNVNQQTIDVLTGAVFVQGVPFGGAAGGLLNTNVTTFNGLQSYNGFNGGLTGSITTNGGDLRIGTTSQVNGAITLFIDTGIGQAIVHGSATDITRLDFSQPGTTGFHKALNGPGTDDQFFGGAFYNVLAFDPMINNNNVAGKGSANGIGLATGVNDLLLLSPAGTPWEDFGTGGVGGVMPTNALDVGRLHQNATLTGIDLVFQQAIFIDSPLGKTGQSFKDLTPSNSILIDSSKTPLVGGALQGQAMSFDYALPTADNIGGMVINNVNAQGGTPSLTLRDFEIDSAAPELQNPITTLVLSIGRTTAAPQTTNVITLDNLNRLTRLDLQGGSANFFNDGATTFNFIDAIGGGGTLTTIVGNNANTDISYLAFDYMSAKGGTIRLGNGTNTIGAFAGNWDITFGKVPGGGTAEDSGNSLVYLIPDLGSRHTVKAGGGHDTFVIGRIFATPLQPDGGTVDIAAGAGEDWFIMDQSGPLPTLNSAQKLDGGADLDRIQLVDGALNENDSVFGQVTSVEELRLADGKFNNSLLLNFFADTSGLNTIITAGGGSSNVFFEGTGFDNAMTYKIANGDLGRDAIIVAALPSGTNAIAVQASTKGYNDAFESGLLTAAINPGTGLPTPSGIFANPFAENSLLLRADGGTANIFGNGTFGTHAIQTIIGVSGGVGVSETVWLVNDPAIATGVRKIDLSAVEGPTTVYGTASSLALTITGGVGATNTLFGGFAADTIVAKGTGPGLGANFLWGAGGGDILTGVAGGAQDTTGSVFLIDLQFESPGGPQQTAAGIDVTITNFHSPTDTLLINPGSLVLGDIPVFIGTATNYLGALALLSGGGAAQTQAVYQADIGALWIDSDNNGLLNASDIEVFTQFASPGFQLGSTNFGNLLGLFTGADVAAYIDGRLNPPGNVTVSGTLLPGQFLFGDGPGFKDKLTLDGGNVADGILIGFEQLEFTDGTVGTLSVKQWNTFNLVPGAITGPGINTAHFLDGYGVVSSGMITVAAIENYDFSALSDGILMSTRAYFGKGAPQGAGTVIGTQNDDWFNVTDAELKGGFTIDGKGGTDKLQVDAVLTFGTKVGQTGDAGTTDAVVLNVETLILLDGTNDVGFNPGTQFTQVIGGAGQDIIRDPQNLAGAWLLDVMGGSGLFNTNIIEVNNKATNLAAGTIQATGGLVALDISADGPSNTTMTVEQYQLFVSSQLGPFYGIFLTGGSTFANTTITFSNQVTGGAALDGSVRNWVFSGDDDSFTLGKLDQHIDIAAGGVDTASLAIAGKYTAVFTGGDNDDILRFAGDADISGVNGGGATTFGKADFTNNNRSVTMVIAQHNAFARPFLNTDGTQTIHLGDSGIVAGAAGIDTYVLASGNDTFKVAADDGAFKQSVDISSGGADVIQYGSPFSGDLIGATGDDKVQFLAGGGEVDISKVNGGTATGAGTVSFSNADIAARMTLDQYNGFATFLDMAGTQTITLTTSGVATAVFGGIETFILASGDDTFTATKFFAVRQTIDISSGGADTIAFGPFGNFINFLVGAGDDDTVKFFGAVLAFGVNDGLAFGAKYADFGGDGTAVAMTTLQHNSFGTPFLGTTGTQLIELDTGGVATGDAGIETYEHRGIDSLVFTVAADNAILVGGKQNVTVSSFSDDTLVFGGGTFSGTYSNIHSGVTIEFTGGADISGAANLAGAGKVDFNDTSVSVKMTAAEHNGFTQPFGETAGVQTITLTTIGTVIGDVGIENYVLSTAGGSTFTIAKDTPGFKQNVTVVPFLAQDTFIFGSGTYSGDVKGATNADIMSLTGGITDISGVNGGGGIGGLWFFNDADLTLTLTAAQFNVYVTWQLTGGIQTVILTTSGSLTARPGTEYYILASGDDVFFDANLVKHTIDIGSGGNDTIVFGFGPFDTTLLGADADDTILVGSSDISGVNAGKVTGAGLLSFAGSFTATVMTLEQHNAFSRPFLGTNQFNTITLTTDGIAIGDAGIEQYILGQDGADTNKFTIGAPSQNVTGRNDDDIVISKTGGTTGTLLGGLNHANGDTLILQAANTDIKAGSGGFENLTLEAIGDSTVRMDVAFHNGITKNVVAPGKSDTIILSDFTANVTGLKNIENYTLETSTGAFKFTLNDSQTGVITGSDDADVIVATGDQMRVLSLKIDTMGGSGQGGGDTLIITTDARDVDLQARTAGVALYRLDAGSTKNVAGANGNGITYDTSVGNANTILTMGVGKQIYTGGSGSDDVIFGTGDGTVIDTGAGNDTVQSTVGGAWSAVTSVQGGDGTDTLRLIGGDDLTAASVGGFENLVLATNAAVTMDSLQYNQFNGASTVGLGNETISLSSGLTSGTTMKGVENYILQYFGNNLVVAYDDQTINLISVSGTFSINAGLDGVKIAGANSAGANVFLDSNTNLDIQLGGAADHIYVAGTITGSIRTGDGTPFNDTLHLHNGANISQATLGTGGDTEFEILNLEDNGSFTMTADQYIDLTTPGNTVDANGFETVIITTSSGATIFDRPNIEAYVLAGSGNDTFRYDVSAGGAPVGNNNHTLDIAAGGNDRIILENQQLIINDEHITVDGFKTGGDADIIVSTSFGTNIGNGGFQTITAAATDLVVGANSTIVINTTVTKLTDPADVQTQVRNAIALAIKANPNNGDYTVALYDTGGNAEIYQARIQASADVTAADVVADYAALLTGISPNSLVGTNFA
jgi:hypothetical protein